MMILGQILSAMAALSLRCGCEFHPSVRCDGCHTCPPSCSGRPTYSVAGLAAKGVVLGVVPKYFVLSVLLEVILHMRDSFSLIFLLLKLVLGLGVRCSGASDVGDSQGDVVLMLELIQYQRWWHPCTVCTMSNSFTYELQRCMSSCGTSYSRQAAAHEAYAIFVSFELIRRRRVRAPSMPLLRFNGEDPPGLSSVMALLDLQLIPLPHRHLPVRLLVEPLALRLVRLQEATEEYDRKFDVYKFASDPLVGSGCPLCHMLHVSSVAYLLCVQLGTSGFFSVMWS
jgi:hypothetical protein